MKPIKQIILAAALLAAVCASALMALVSDTAASLMAWVCETARARVASADAARSSAAVAFSWAWMALTMLYWSSQLMVFPGGQRSRTVPNQ